MQLLQKYILHVHMYICHNIMHTCITTSQHVDEFRKQQSHEYGCHAPQYDLYGMHGSYGTAYWSKKEFIDLVKHTEVHCKLCALWFLVQLAN